MWGQGAIAVGSVRSAGERSRAGSSKIEQVKEARRSRSARPSATRRLSTRAGNWPPSVSYRRLPGPSWNFGGDPHGLTGTRELMGGKDVTRSSPVPIYTAQEACAKPRVVPHNRPPQARTYGNGRSEMRVFFSTYPTGGRL
jgi:hypothetical protein